MREYFSTFLYLTVALLLMGLSYPEFLLNHDVVVEEEDDNKEDQTEDFYDESLSIEDRIDILMQAIAEEKVIWHFGNFSNE